MTLDQDFIDTIPAAEWPPQAAPRIPRVRDWRPLDDQDDDLCIARGILRALVWCACLWTVAAMTLLLMLP